MAFIAHEILGRREVGGQAVVLRIDPDAAFDAGGGAGWFRRVRVVVMGFVFLVIFINAAAPTPGPSLEREGGREGG